MRLIALILKNLRLLEFRPPIKSHSQKSIMIQQNNEKSTKTAMKLLSSAVSQAKAMKQLIRFTREHFKVAMNDSKHQEMAHNFFKIEGQIGTLISEGRLKS